MAVLTAAGALCPEGAGYRYQTNSIAGAERELLRTGDRIYRAELVGNVTFLGENELALADASGSTWVYLKAPFDFRAGDKVRLQCDFKCEPGRSMACEAHFGERIRTGTPPAVVPADMRDMEAGRLDNLPVSVDGTLTDVYTDEIDPEWGLAVLETQDQRFTLSFRLRDWSSLAEIERYVDSEVSIVGAICRRDGSTRTRYQYRTLFVANRTILRRKSVRTPGFPHRERFQGMVSVSWNGEEFFLAADDGHCYRVRLARGETLPENDSRVIVDGFVRSNEFFTKLDNALVRRLGTLSSGTVDVRPVPTLRPDDILRDDEGRLKIKSDYDGCLIRLVGRIHDRMETPGGCVLAFAGSEDIRFDAILRGLPPPEVGSTVELTGVCKIAYDSEGKHGRSVQLTGFSVIPRGPEDIRILACPPWWTPGRFLIALFALLLLVVVIILRNRRLERLVERRGRELLEEQIGRATADLRTEERTRLAVELHDSLSQTLTGVSMQLDTARNFAGERPEAMARHLGIASKTLASCRTELKNCLFDLRSDALAAKTMDEAIRSVLDPFRCRTEFRIRFGVRREILSDPTAHAILRIIRELAANAVRHGGAACVRIAGAVENGRILMSVADDGCGFDPETVPGMSEGHFGLEGIRERVERFGGTTEVKSSPGNGAKITIAIDLPKEIKEGNP